MKNYYGLAGFIAFIGFSFSVKAQTNLFLFRPLNWEEKTYSHLAQDSLAHSSIWPQKTNALDHQSEYSLVKPYDYKGDSKSLNWLLNSGMYHSLIRVEHKDYSLQINPLFHLQLGQAGNTSTYYNGRGVQVEGRIGSKFYYQGTFIEQQARFADYLQDYYRDKGSTLGWVMHRTMDNGDFDFPYSVGQIAYEPSKHFTFSLGHGNHFFGDGYRSLFLSDHTAPYGFFRIETQFWKLKYINLYGLMNDINPLHASPGGIYAQKFLSAHYLSWDVTDKLSIQIFESFVQGSDTTGQAQGFDWNFANPIILYRAIEGNRGFRIGNTMLGFGASYKLSPKLQFYGQLAIDDFQFAALQQIGDGHWLNFFGTQLGIKSVEPFDLKGLFILAEFNQARPFTYQHRSTFTNYEHQGLPLAHPWETNFREFLIRFFYKYDRWEVVLNANYGFRGLDTAGLNFGNDIRRSYEDRPPFELGYFLGGPLRENLFHSQFSLAYILNPVTNLRAEVSYTYRNQQFADKSTAVTHWFNVGIRTAIHWGYQDVF